MEEKRIGIFTYMLNNYGAVLQAYALQRYLRNNSRHHVEMVDFITDFHVRHDKIFRAKSNNFIKTLALMLLTLLRYRQLKQRQKRTHEFKRLQFNYTRHYSTTEDLCNNPPQEDIYVTGSDQVFNLDSAFADVYYLKFDKGNGRKVAYAPSFGTALFDNAYAEKIRPVIADFDVLSCREQTGADFLTRLTGKEVPVVADPTMLLTAREWNMIAVKPKYDNYICVYDLNGGYDLMTIARKIKDRTGYRIVCITSNVKQRYHADKVVYNAGPAEFVGWFANSNYVVTDSFHGTSFALIFNKPFNTYIALPSRADRIYSILKKNGQDFRIVSNRESIDYVFDKRFEDVPKANLDSFVQGSYMYINDNILK